MTGVFEVSGLSYHGPVYTTPARRGALHGREWRHGELSVQPLEAYAPLHIHTHMYTYILYIYVSIYLCIRVERYIT